MEPLNGEFIVNDGDHNSAMLGLQTTIDDQFISRIDTGQDDCRALGTQPVRGPTGQEAVLRDVLRHSAD